MCWVVVAGKLLVLLQFESNDYPLITLNCYILVTSRLNLMPSLGVPRSLKEQPKDDCPSLKFQNNIFLAFHIEPQTDKTLLAVHLNQAKREKTKTKQWKVDRYFKGCVWYGNFLQSWIFFSLLATALFPSVRFFRCSLSQSVSEVRAKIFSLGVCPTIITKNTWLSTLISYLPFFFSVRWHWPNNPHCSFQKWTLTRSSVLL